MDAPQRALADLTEISSQIRLAVLLDEAGEIVAATADDEAEARRLAGGAKRLLALAEELRGSAALTQLEAATTRGSVFIARDDTRTIAATTGPDPTVGLVFYDLKSALRSAALDAGGAA